jgi:hypothetical protein
MDLALRAEEQKALAQLGRFRVTTRDLAKTIYGGRTDDRMERDLAYLVEHGLVKVNVVNATARWSRRAQGTPGSRYIDYAGRQLLVEAGGLPPLRRPPLYQSL